MYKPLLLSLLIIVVMFSLEEKPATITVSAKTTIDTVPIESIDSLFISDSAFELKEIFEFPFASMDSLGMHETLMVVDSSGTVLAEKNDGVWTINNCEKALEQMFELMHRQPKLQEGEITPTALPLFYAKQTKSKRIFN